MGFKENLLKKMEIDQLSDQVRRSMVPVQGTQTIDRDAMRTLLEMSTYAHRRERDMDLYIRDDTNGMQRILVLDNGLNLYRTTVEDVGLRKSPTLKEMVRIRNAVKILSDKDVLLSRKADTLLDVQKELIDTLDLSYTTADIEALAQDGRQALENNYTDGIIEIISLFCVVLRYPKAPPAFQLPHFLVWGAVRKLDEGQLRMSPIILFSQMHNRLQMLETPISTIDKAGMLHYMKVAKGEAKADFEGKAVLEALKGKVFTENPSPAEPFTQTV
jgi:hypothetical protein